jgi:TPR repeat protein
MKRVGANDAASMFLLAGFYYQGLNGLQQDHSKGMEFLTKSADLGCSLAHCKLADVYDEGGDIKKANFHYETAAMAGDEVARYNLGIIEAESGNIERAVKHWKIAASAGQFHAMHNLRIFFEHGLVDREYIDTILTAQQFVH